MVHGLVPYWMFLFQVRFYESWGGGVLTGEPNRHA